MFIAFDAEGARDAVSADCHQPIRLRDDSNICCLDPLSADQRFHPGYFRNRHRKKKLIILTTRERIFERIAPPLFGITRKRRRDGNPTGINESAHAAFFTDVPEVTRETIGEINGGAGDAVLGQALGLLEARVGGEVAASKVAETFR